MDNDRPLALGSSCKDAAELGNEAGNVVLVVRVGGIVSPRRSVAIPVLTVYDKESSGILGRNWRD